MITQKDIKKILKVIGIVAVIVLVAGIFLMSAKEEPGIVGSAVFEIKNDSGDAVRSDKDSEDESASGPNAEIAKKNFNINKNNAAPEMEQPPDESAGSPYTEIAQKNSLINKLKNNNAAPEMGQPPDESTSDPDVVIAKKFRGKIKTEVLDLIKEKGKKRVIIRTNTAEHLYNITASTSIPESGIKPRLYHLIGSFRLDVTNNPLYNVQHFDTDNNGKYDRLQWLIPELSEQVFEIEIIVLTLHSIPERGENWTVYFNTTGIANLSITLITNLSEDYITTWAEWPVDAPETVDHLKFIELYGNGQPVEHTKIFDENRHIIEIFVEDWNYSQGILINEWLRGGRHAIKFTFGDKVAYAYNADYYRVNNGATVTIDEWSTCKKVTNACGAGKDIFVPTKTSLEWSTFRSNKPGCVSLAECCGGLEHDGNCWYITGAGDVSCTTLCSTHGGCIAGQYDNNPNCYVCNALTGSSFCNPSSHICAPMYRFSSTICYYGTSGAASCSAECTDYYRICACNN